MSIKRVFKERKMKKVSFLMVSVVFLLCLCACNKGTTTSSSTISSSNSTTSVISTPSSLSSSSSSSFNSTISSSSSFNSTSSSSSSNSSSSSTTSSNSSSTSSSSNTTTSSSSSSSSSSTSSSSSSSSSSTSSSSSIIEINPLDNFNITAVAGVEIKDNSVTLTKSQYDALVLSPETNCDYTLLNGVKADISVTENRLIFDLTSPTGNKDKYIITLIVLSNLADININTIYNKKVVNGKVTFSETEYASFLNLEDYSSVCDYQASEGATVKIEFDKQTHTFSFNVLSQDKTQRNEVKVEINVELPFGTHSLTGSGDKKYVTYDYENLLYSLNGSATVTDEKGKNLNGNYAFSAQIYPQSLAQGSEVVLSAVYANNYQIRFVLRGVDESHYLIFSDYKDRSDFLNYKEHISSTEYDKEQGVNMGVIVVDGSMAMTIDGNVIYRRALPELNYTEMFISTYECTAQIKNLQIVSDEVVVLQIIRTN